MISTDMSLWEISNSGTDFYYNKTPGWVSYKVYFLFCKVWSCPATKEENTETNGQKNHHFTNWHSYADGL